MADDDGRERHCSNVKIIQFVQTKCTDRESAAGRNESTNGLALERIALGEN